MCDIIKMMPHNGYSQIFRSERKNILSPTPDARSALLPLFPRADWQQSFWWQGLIPIITW